MTKELDKIKGELDKITAKRDKAIIDEINDWNLNWDHVWMNYNGEQLSQLLTQRVAYTLDRIGATKEGLHFAIEIDRSLSKKFPFDNTKETNLKRLAIKKEIVEKEIEFWRKID